MKDFIQRNSPIFVIGFFTLVVFVIIIIFAQFKKQISPELKPITKEQATNMENFDQPKTRVPEISEVDQKFQPIEILYTDNGFEPKNSKVVVNQLIRFTNKTKDSIKILQITKTEDQYKDGISIEPDSTAEVRLTKPKTWSFYEEVTEFKGSVFVVDN